LKHLPRWQFLGLFGIVAGEASLKRRLSALTGRADDARAWRAIGEIARKLRRGPLIRGREALLIAEGVERPRPRETVEDREIRSTIAAEDRQIDEKDWIS
jgi:hypothetical protein